MSFSKNVPYGSWKSPITAELLVAKDSVRLSSIFVEEESIYWAELRPSEKGRVAIMVRDKEGESKEITPKEYNVRTRVHEYGGAAFLVHKGVVYFSNFSDQGLYRMEEGKTPSLMTVKEAIRFADGVYDEKREKIYYVREDHRGKGEAVNALVSIDPKGENQEGESIASGYDFYSNPCLNREKTGIAYLCWNHPHMPWDETELWVADLDEEGHLSNRQKIAGGQGESIFQPQWGVDGNLYFVSDKTLWGNLYRWNGEEIEPLCPKEVEFGYPQWLFGFSKYAFISEKEILCSVCDKGRDHLAILSLESKELKAVLTPYTDIQSLRSIKGNGVFIAGGPLDPSSIVYWEKESKKSTVLKKSKPFPLEKSWVSQGELISYPSEKETSYAFFYPPKNPNYAAPQTEKPPLIVMSHGGPTGHVSNALNLQVQYWTTRGFAVIDVNYGGSSGHGRKYRKRLEGNWGIVDVRDCVNGVLYLAQKGLIDPNRVAIRGGSAGGYTTLAALAFSDVFKAGCSYYGVSDLTALAKDTHKFESRYLDGLVGPYPEKKELYEKRSPIHAIGKIHCPILLLQGAEDRVVPPSQSEKMYKIVKEKKIPTAYLLFEGEQHGFRQAKNMKKALEAESYFYAKIFGFTLADPVEPISIANL